MYHFFSRISFIVGIILGILLAVIVEKYNNQTKIIKNITPFNRAIYDYQKWIEDTDLKRQKPGFDKLRYGQKNEYLESTYLYDKVNVLCIILLQQAKNEQIITDTWSKSCNHVKFINLTRTKKKLPNLNVRRDSTSWTLLCTSFFQVPEDVKWVLVVHDYTFVIVENLRLFIASLSHLEDYYFGHALWSWDTVYNSGHSGYVFSRGALQKLIKKLDSTDGCENKWLYNKKEDLYLGKYFESLNITASDTRDHEGLSTFHPYNLRQLFSPMENQYQDSVYPIKCCSKYSITFQSADTDKMYTFYYLLYSLQIFHSGDLGNLPSSNKNDDKIWKKFLREQDLPFNLTAEQYYQVWVDLVDDPIKFVKHFKYKNVFDYD